MDDSTELCCFAVLHANLLIRLARLRGNESSIRGTIENVLNSSFESLEKLLVAIGDLGYGPKELNRFRGLPGIEPPPNAASWHEYGFALANEIYQGVCLQQEMWEKVGCKLGEAGIVPTSDDVFQSPIEYLCNQAPKFDDSAIVANIRREGAIAERLQATVAATPEKQTGKKPILTAPMTKTKLANYFVCHRNNVKEKVLDVYPHKTVGSKMRERYRMHVADMPPAYHQERSKPKS
jgi:hypothetical protein